MAKRKRSNVLIWVLVAIIVIGVAIALLVNQGRSEGERVTVEKVEKRTIKETVAASGKVFPQTEVKISSDVSGEIVELYVEEGDSVVAEQLLAKIDPDAYQSQVERGVASVNSAKAQLANSRSQVENLQAQKENIEAQLKNAREIYQRNKQLYDEGVISEADFETAASNLEALEANLRSSDANIRAAKQSVKAAEYQVRSAEASLKELRTSLRRTSIYAPMSGIISLLNVEQGERVVGTIQMTGTEMMRIANLNAMEVRVDVSENDIPRVSLGDDVDIEVDAYLDRIFRGRVTQIANSASNSATAALTSDQVTNFEVRINIDPASYQDLITTEKPYPFRPGMSATVDINTETRENVLSLPIQAVTAREKKELKEMSGVTLSGHAQQLDDDEFLEFVFKTTAADTVGITFVRTGIQDDTYIEIQEGLQDSDEVVTGPYSVISRKLKPGDEIERVKRDELIASDN